MIGAPLYIYAANTSTPADAYQDFGLDIPHPWPIRTDSAGYIPAFWLDDGNYRARFTDAAGAVVYFDIQNIQAVGPSTGDESGGGSSVDQNAIFQTGDPIWVPRKGTRAGWVRLNGRTIGSASSGATERANADTQALYEYLWTNFSDTLCPVTGGRGVSAASDFAANKPIATYTMRGKGAVGLDDMGNSAAGVIEDGTPTEISFGGNEKITLARSALPNVTLSVTGATNTAGAHTHTYPCGGTPRAADGSGPNDAATDDPGVTGSAGAHSHTVSGTAESINGNVSQTKINVMGPYMLGTWYVRL